MSYRVEVNPIKCEAHGLCAELLPERISLDEWGYPVIGAAPIPASLEGLARRAVDACPTLALRLAAIGRAEAAAAAEVGHGASARDRAVRRAQNAAGAHGSGREDRPYRTYRQGRDSG